jgi:serine/threonine-protein kinase
MATVAAAVWVYVTYRDPSPPAIAASEPPAPSAAPTPTGPASATPSTAEGSGALEGTDVGALPVGFGYLTVTFPATANVHLNGKALGAANQPLQARCGRWYLRLAQPGDARFPAWVSPGMTVTVACQGSTTVDVMPGPGQPQRPRR